MTDREIIFEVVYDLVLQQTGVKECIFANQNAQLQVVNTLQCF